MSDFVPIRRLHHRPYRCRDAAATRRFYDGLLGLPLVHVISRPGAVEVAAGPSAP